MRNRTMVFFLVTLAHLALILTHQAWAAPGFDLDLKELKKPAPPQTVSKKKATVAHKKKQAKATPKPLPAVPSAAPVVHSAPPVAPVIMHSELALKGGDACQLAERMAIAVARSVTVEQLQLGLSLKPVVAVRYGNLEVLITCGIPSAEAYTYGRLLEGHQIGLLNIEGNESIGQVARAITDALALSYSLEVDTATHSGELIYTFPAEFDRQRPLRLTLQP